LNEQCISCEIWVGRGEEADGGEREEEKVDPDAHLGKYEKMMKEMGGQEACELRAAEWIKFAAHVRRKAQRELEVAVCA
jgi:hypothetical protein